MQQNNRKNKEVIINSFAIFSGIIFFSLSQHGKELLQPNKQVVGLKSDAASGIGACQLNIGLAVICFFFIKKVINACENLEPV